MATATDHFCDICVAKDTKNIAIKWCPECKDALCPDCVKHHSVHKSSRNHAIIELKDQKRLPDFISSISQSCEEHNEKFQMFCTHHDVPCCGQCIAYNHNMCEGLLPMADILDNAKTSSTLQNVEDILTVISKNIEIIIKERTQNMNNVESQICSVRCVITETREKLLKHLDKLENDIVTEIESKATEINQQNEKVVKDLTEKKLKVEEYQNNVKAIKEYGTNIQTFFGTREVAKYAESEEMRIKKLFEDGTLNNYNIQFKLDEGIGSCLNADTFGTMLFTTIESMVKPVETKGLAAQVSKEVIQPKSVDDINVVLKTNFQILKGKFDLTITGCDVTPDGKLVFADCYYNNRIVLHTVDGSFINEMSICPNFAFDVSVIEEQSVVVSADDKIIQIGNISTIPVIKTYNANNTCYGITHVDGKFLSAISNTGIVSYECYDTKDNLSTTIRTEALGDCSYVTCFLDKIYYTNTVDSSVTCVNQNGEIVWKFIDKSLVYDPRGIATDRHENVFVSSWGNKSIVAISSDGERGKKILDGKDGINNACAICYDKRRNKLVIANFSGDVFVFDIF